MPRLFLVEEVAEMYGVSVDTVYGWLTSGALVGFKLARTWRITASDWRDFLDRLRAEAVADLGDETAALRSA